MKFRLVLSVALLASPAAAANPSDDAVTVLVKCTDVTDREARLDCYDRSAPQLRAAAQAQAAAPVEAANAAPPPAVEPAAPSDQGSVLDSLNPFSGEAEPGPSATQMAYQPIGQEILPVTIGVARYDVASNGAFTVTLDNGQVWRERNEHYDTPPFGADAKNSVRIEHGLIGGYNLYLKGYGKPYKVQRVK